MVLSVLCVYVRSIYRTVELLQGWKGFLITRERYFVALDGAMMVVAVAVFNVLHPGWLLLGKEKTERMKRDVSGDEIEMDRVFKWY